MQNKFTDRIRLIFIDLLNQSLFCLFFSFFVANEYAYNIDLIILKLMLRKQSLKWYFDIYCILVRVYIPLHAYIH